MKYVISATAILLVNVGVFALPQGGRIESGKGNLDNPAHIIQESQHLQTRWNSFDIGAKEQVRIQQPNAQASINIKVSNGAATNINGTLTANGRVSLENPAGIQFGANSVVNVGGLLASSANGAVTSLGQVSAAAAVRFQGLSSKNVVNVGGNVSAQEIIVESNGNIVIGNSAHFTASQQVLIGGGYQGKDSTVLNARTTNVKAAAQIVAPRVIVWSDKETSFLGRINAGKGFVEVSGKQNLIFPDISRVIAGTLLLDPANITIVAGAGANDSEFADSIINADDSASSTFTLGTSTINSYGATLYLSATDTITVNADITKIGGLFLAANNFVINAAIAITSGQLSFELTGVSPSAPFVFGSGGALTTDVLTIAINYTNNYQFTPDASFTAHLVAPGRSVTIEVPNGDVSLNNGLNLCQVDTFPACGNLTIASRALSLTGTFFADGVDLTVTAGAIDFSSTPTITALTIALTQVDAFPAAAPADFGTIVPTLSASVGFSKLSWGNCGRNCLDPATDIIITDGNLTTALTSKGIAASGQVDLGSLNLMSSGMSLTIPAGITGITTTGTISITGGLTTTASVGLTFTADTITFGGAMNFGVNNLTLNFGTSLGGGTTAPTLTVDFISVRHTGTGPVVLPEWLFTGQNVSLHAAEISIPTATTWDVVGLGFEADTTTITGEALTLTTTASFISAVGFNLTIDVASFSIGNNLLLLADNLNVTSRAAGADNGFNLALSGDDSLTVAGHISAGTGTGTLALTATSGKITFTSNPTLTGGTITLKQAVAYDPIKPANFSTPPTLNSGSNFNKPAAWGVCGTNCLPSLAPLAPLAPADLAITDGVLDTALTGKFAVVGGTLDLGAFNLTASGASLTIPSTITTITTTGTISITGGLTATAALTLNADTLTLSGAFNAGTNVLTLSFGTSIVGGATAPTLTVGGVTARYTGTGALILPSWLFGAHDVALDIAEIDIPTATTWTFDGLSFPSDTTITGAALTLTSTGAISAGDYLIGAGDYLTIDVASLSFGSAITLVGQNINITSRAAGTSNAFNLSMTARQSLTVAGHINAGTGALELTSNNGSVIFTSNPTITGATITLTQTAAYAATAPANFSTPPTLNSSTSFTALSWGVCGTNCLVPASADLVITDGYLTRALALGRFVVSGGTLDLGSLNLTASGMSLDIPSTITAIITTGKISITDGLTASKALTLTADTLTLGGAIDLGTNDLNLTFFAASLSRASAPTPTLTVGSVTARYTGTGAPTLPSWLFGAHGVALDIAEINIPTATTWTFDGLSFPRDTTITGAALTLTSTGAFLQFITAGADLTINVASLSFGSAMTLLGDTFNITSRAAGTSNAFNLSMTAQQSLTVAGHINAGTGALGLTSNNGSVIFTSNPTITGATITLMQSAAFVSNSPATFSIKPVASRIGLATYSVPDWTACPSGDSNCSVFANIPTMSGGAADITLTDVISGKFTISGNTLDLLGADLVLSTTANIILPAGLTTITTSGTITLVAASIITTGTTTIGTALTINANTLTIGGTWNLGTRALTLTADSGAIVFNSGTDITAGSIALTQMAAYAASAPATFSTAPTLAAPSNFDKPTAWGVCGTNCFVPENLTITDGNLGTALTGKFDVSSDGTLDLGAFNLTASGSSLTIPSTILSITTTGTISITDGLTATAALNLNAGGALTIGGTWNLGNRALALATGVVFAASGVNISAGNLAINFASNVSFPSSVTFTATGNLTLIGDNISSSDVINLSYGGTLGGTPTLSSATSLNVTYTGAGSTTLPSWVFGAYPTVLTVAEIRIAADTTWAGNSVTFAGNTSIAGVGNLTLNVSTIDAGTNDLTINLPILTFGNSTTITAANINLTALAGGINFGTTSTVTATTAIVLSQTTAYAATAPATFSPTPTVTSPISFRKPSWGNCGANCFDSAHLVITDGDLTSALTDRFVLTGTTLDLGSFNLTASGTSLTIPSTITTITTTGTISITGGLTTTAGGRLTLTADMLTLGGAINLGTVLTDELVLNFATSLVGGATAPTLTAGNIVVRHTGSGPVALPEWLFTGQSVDSYVAEISIPTAATWDVASLGFEVNTTITGEALTLTAGSAPFIGAAGLNLTIDVASLSFGSDMTLLAGHLNITSRTAGADNGFNLTLTATESVTVAGHISAGTGDLSLTAGSRAKITFTGNPTITGATITLSQGMSYDLAVPAQFSVTPVASRTGFPAGTTYAIGVWATCPSSESDCRVEQHITMIGETTNIALGTLLAGKFNIVGGVLDLLGSDLTLETTARISFPLGLSTIITSGNITLIAGSFFSPNAPLTIETTASGILTFQGTYDVGRNYGLTLTSAGALNFGRGAETSITARTLTLSSGAATTASRQKLTLSGLLFIALNNTDINVAELVLESHGEFTGTPTITTPDLTLNYTGGDAPTATYAGSHWAFVEGRNVTLRTTNSSVNMTLFAVNATDSISLCAADGTTCGNLTLESAGGIELAHNTQTSASLGAISANDITLRAATRIGNDSANINRNLILNVAGNLVIDTPSFALRNTHGAALTFNVAGTTTFVQDTTVDVETISGLGGTIIAAALTLSSADSTTGSIAFDTARETTITATGDLTLEFESATTTPSGQDLTLETTGGDITLGGSLSIGGGTLEITTDQNIVFTSNPTITAAEITLTWEGNTDFGTTAPATFTDGTNTILPFVEEAPNQTLATWFLRNSSSLDTGSADIDFIAGVTLTRGLDTFVISVSADGVLDFGDYTISLTTTGNIILPANVREIRARNLTINAATMGVGTQVSPFANPLSIITTNDLELNVAIAMNPGVALNLTFGDDLKVAPAALTTTSLGIAYTGTGAITLPSWVFGSARQLRLNVANITFAGNTTWVADSISFGENTTIASANNLSLNVPTLDAGANSLTINVARLSFSQTNPSNITGGAISISSASAPILGSRQNLTITATTGNLTLQGALNVSPGNMVLTATQGVIVFVNNPTLRATSFALTQGSTAFPATKPANFINETSASVRPTLRLLAGVQLPVDWDVELLIEVLPETAGGGYDLAILTSTGGALEAFETSRGILDFGNTDLILGTDNNITIPDRITEIRGRNIIIRATMFARGDASATNPLNRNFQFVATENIVFMADIQSDSRITFTGRSITFNSAKATQISGSEIFITTTNPGHANNQNVTLEATGNITLNANLNIGLGSLVVNAGGDVIITDAATVTAHTISYPASAIRNGANSVSLTAYDNIYLLGTRLNNRDAPVSLIAGGSIVTGGAFDITGSAVHFEQGQARYQAGRLLLHARTGNLTVVGPIARDMITLRVSSTDQLDRSNAVIEGAVTIEVSP